MRMRRKAWTEPLLDICPYLINQPKEQKGSWRGHFADPSLPLHLEIGCGKGVSTVKMAHENKNTNFIAIDEVRHVLAVTIKNAGIEYGDDSVDNLVLSAVDAMFITDTFAMEDGIERIYINFCNPWNEKAKQHKRRLTHPRQLMQYRSFMKIGSEIHFKTDDVPLFTASKRYLADCGFEITYLTDDLHASGYEPNYVSEHEKFYSDKGIPIHFLIAKMVELPEDFSCETEGRKVHTVNERGTTGRYPKETSEEE